MLVAKPVGRNAATRKYDILSAMTTYALSQDKHRQRSVLRLICLITTRYNWQRDELTIGQSEIARLWSVDIRTVKREMAKFRATGWIVEKRAAVRGRVAMHGLNLSRIMAETKACWPLIGPDFVARVSVDETKSSTTDSNVIPIFPAKPVAFDDDLWGQISRDFHQTNPALFGAWIKPLKCLGVDAGALKLSSPSRFHSTYIRTNILDRLTLIAAGIDPTVQRISIIVDASAEIPT